MRNAFFRSNHLSLGFSFMFELIHLRTAMQIKSEITNRVKFLFYIRQHSKFDHFAKPKISKVLLFWIVIKGEWFSGYLVTLNWRVCNRQMWNLKTFCTVPQKRIPCCENPWTLEPSCDTNHRATENLISKVRRWNNLRNT